MAQEIFGEGKARAPSSLDAGCKKRVSWHTFGPILPPMPFPKHILFLAFVTFSSVVGIRAEIKVQSGQKVAFMGDSITQFGWDRPGGYVHLVADALESSDIKIAVISAGISGNTSRNMLDRLDKSVISKKPDWMTLSCGVNDVWHHDATHVDLEPYKANITAIVDKAQAAGIKVVILTATVISESDNTDNQAQGELAKAFTEKVQEAAK